MNSGDYKPLIEAIANTNPNLNLKGTDFSVVYFNDGRLEFYPYSLKELYDNLVFYKITNEVTCFISSWQEILFSFGMEIYDGIPKSPSNLDIPESYYSIIPENKILQEKIVQTMIDNHGVKHDMEKRLSIPSWFKITASWWAEGIVSDKEFIDGLEYMIEIDIISVSKESSISLSTQSDRKIPYWIKNNVELWNHGTISDKEFLNGIEWLVNQNINKIN